MKKVIISFKMPHGSYCGGVASTINAYLDQKALFHKEGIQLELFDYIEPTCFEHIPSKIRNVIYGVFQKRALIKKLRNASCDLVHIHTSRQFLFLKDIWLARAIKRKRHISVFITIHVGAAETVFERIGFTGKQTIHWINKYVDKVIFLSNGIRNEFIQLGMVPERGVTLGNFHSLDKVTDEQQLPDIAKLHLLFVGAIHRDKGILELLKAMLMLPGEDVHLDVCGILTDPSIKNEIDDLLSKLGNRVTLHGYVTGQEKAALFQRADVLVLPSYHEGFPLVILEALASGCGIISTPVGAIPEALDESNTLWVHIGSDEEIRAAITKMVENENLLIKMKQKNKLLSKDYSVENHIHMLCRIYNNK